MDHRFPPLAPQAPADRRASAHALPLMPSLPWVEWLAVAVLVMLLA